MVDSLESRDFINRVLSKLSKEDIQKLLDYIVKDIDGILKNTRDKGFVVYKQTHRKSDEILRKI